MQDAEDDERDGEEVAAGSEDAGERSAAKYLRKGGSQCRCGQYAGTSGESEDFSEDGPDVGVVQVAEELRQVEDEHAQEQPGAKQRGREMGAGADEQSRGGSKQKDAGSDREHAADGIPGRSDYRKDAQVLQAKAGEGEGKEDTGNEDDAIHGMRGRAESLGDWRHDT